MVVSGLFVVWVWCVFGKASHPSNETELSHCWWGERDKHQELFHKIKRAHRDGQRLAPAIG
jgi:hypothetical protein